MNIALSLSLSFFFHIYIYTHNIRYQNISSLVQVPLLTPTGKMDRGKMTVPLCDVLVTGGIPFLGLTRGSATAPSGDSVESLPWSHNSPHQKNIGKYTKYMNLFIIHFFLIYILIWLIGNMAGFKIWQLHNMAGSYYCWFILWLVRIMAGSYYGPMVPARSVNQP